MNARELMNEILDYLGWATTAEQKMMIERWIDAYGIDEYDDGFSVGVEVGAEND